VRELFNQIRQSYRKLKQNVEAMQRQIDSDPHSIQRMKASQQTLEEEKHGEQKDESLVESEG